MNGGGSWRKNLKAFVEWANDEGSIKAPDEPNRDPNASQTVQKEQDRRDVRPGLRFKVFMRDRFRCVACGRSPATHLNVELHADHIVSVYHGGKTLYENLQTVCQECNLGKGRASIPWAERSQALP